MPLQAVERALSEARQAEVSAAALGELCDSLRADEADLRQRLAALYARANAAVQETAEAETKRTAVVEVPLAVSADDQLSTLDISHWPIAKTSRQCRTRVPDFQAVPKAKLLAAAFCRRCGRCSSSPRKPAAARSTGTRLQPACVPSARSWRP